MPIDPEHDHVVDPVSGEQGSPAHPNSESPHLDRPIWYRVLMLAWPVWIQQLLLMFVGLYDQYLAGNNPPADAQEHVAFQAAQTTANYLAWFISSSSAIVSVGGTALVARFIGAQDKLKAQAAANQSIVLAFVLGSFTSLVGLWLLPDLIQMMHMSAKASAMATDFLTPILMLVVFQMIEQAGLACLVGAGDTRPMMWVLGGVSLINIPLAWFCFHGLGRVPGWGFQGIAWGTAISHALGGVAVMVLLYRGRAGLHLRFSALIPNPALIRRILHISIPASIDTLSICLCQLWFLSMVNRLGDVATTAHGMAIRWESLGYLSGQAFATAAAALVGQNLGARRPGDAARAVWVAWGIGSTVMAGMGIIFYIFAPDMFRLFCPAHHQQDVIEAGVPILRLVAFAMPPLACIIIFSGALRGAGATRLPMVLSWIGFLGIRIPLAYLLMFAQTDLTPVARIPGLALGLYGAWLAMFADLIIRGGLFLYRFAAGSWKQVRV